MSDAPQLTRRALVGGAVAATGAATAVTVIGAPPAPAGAPEILKPLPPRRFVDFGTNAEMRWSSVDPTRYLTAQRDLFVRNHTATPRIDRADYELRVFGDGLERPRTRGRGVRLTLRDLQAMPTTTVTTVHECTGNGRSFFETQQGQDVSGTSWTLGAVGAVRWEGVRLATVLRRIGLADGVRRGGTVMATGLDDPYESDGVDYGRVRRPFPVSKALDDALLVWGANGHPLLPDHGYPLRLVLPGWVGIASIKWLGSLEVSRGRLTSPWNTTFYRMTGGDYPEGSPALTVNPVRSAWELPWGAALDAGRDVTLTGRSWSGAAPIRSVAVSLDGGDTWRSARLRPDRRDPWKRGGWTRWSVRWPRPRAGERVLLARATDALGRRQPDVTPYNDSGYFFDAVVRHPVTVA
ncbi:sulfite oxidase [Nocardioides marinquilinus]|uniref:Sulfite oxidase n=1 Tax=Nocardioides marinquilinus TaxID=1210400 RepID=A0ABP9PX62_9ACTN